VPYTGPSTIASGQSADLEGEEVDVTTTNLKSVVEVSDLAQIVQELVDPRFVVLNEGVERDHVGFLRVRRFIRQILEHFGNLRGSGSATRFNLNGQSKPNYLPASEFVSGASPERHRPTYTPGV
jgi:hypothetical protein